MIWKSAIFWALGISIVVGLLIVFALATGNLWQFGVGIAAVVLVLWWWVPKWQMKSITAGDPKDRADIEDNFRKTIGQAFGGIAVLFGAVAAYLQFTQQQNAARDLLISNQIAKGFEQFGSPELVVRLGGIYTLEGVMNGSPRYHQPVLEALCAFIRNGTIEIQINDKAAPNTDIQAALTVIARREPGDGFVDLAAAKIPHSILHRAKLSRADLSNADLNDAALSYAKLIKARLGGTHLSGTFLNNANLVDADVSGADLRGAHLSEAKLTGADLTLADLRGADLSNVKLTGADLRGADLNDADMSGAVFNSQAQLDQACGKPARLPAGLKLDKPCPPVGVRMFQIWPPNP